MNEPLYDTAQLPVLTRLLAKYTEKLRDQCDKHENDAQRRNTVAVFATAIIIVGVTALAGALWTAFHAPSNTLLSPLLKVTRIIVFLFYAIGTVFLAKAFGEMWNGAGKFKRRSLLQMTAAMHQLERLVRRISPIAEYSNLSLGEKLELGLRLTDADAALEYAAQYIGKRSREEMGLAHTAVFK